MCIQSSETLIVEAFKVLYFPYVTVLPSVAQVLNYI